MEGHISLVAGESSAGHQDGAFNESTFNHPWGLAVDLSGEKLYVSDRDNNCIRLVDLENRNTVSTLAGKDAPGYQDGPFDSALFHSPTCLVWIGPDLLAVNDSGNHRIRLLNLKNQTVTTLAGNGADAPWGGPALQSSLADIWSLVYRSSSNCLYFSEPLRGAVRKLDLKTGLVTNILQNQAEIPRPEALCVWQDQLYVADRTLPTVYRVTETTGVPLLEVAGGGKNILSLTASEKGLYALQADDEQPLRQIAPSDRIVHLVSAWGETLPDAGNTLPCFDGLGPESNIQLAPDPGFSGRFYVPNPRWQSLFSLKDIFPEDSIASHMETLLPNGLMDWNYPPVKPAGTFRILVVGDSHVYHTFPDDYKRKGETHYNLMEGLSKRLELELNTLASLEDNPVHFEVLTQALPGTHPLFLWPYYDSPGVIQKYDVDMVLYLFSPNMFTPPMFQGEANNGTDFSFQTYFLHSLTSEGIPARDIDPESLLKPITRKMPSGAAGVFFKHCQKKGLARVEKTELWFADFDRLVEEPDIEKDLVGLIGKPIRMLHEKVARMKTSGGQPVAFYLGLLPSGQFYPMKAQKPFWNDLKDYAGAPLLDLSEDFTALRPAWYPLSDHQEYDHFSADGYFVEALVLAHELVQRRMVPWPPK